MNKLEPNMYVRTKSGIAKIVQVGIFNHVVDNFDFIVESHLILKASNNIIDLIEVGDYVNGYKITLIHETYNVLYAEDERGYLIKSFGEEDIKSIVTKEQFKSMEYELGE